MARVWPLSGSPQETAGTLGLLDIYALSTVILHWTRVFTVTIACVIVWLMKGPAYVADAYPLPDSNRPVA